MHPVTYIGLVLGFVGFTVYSLTVAKRSRKDASKGANPMPGPYQLPIIGRIHDLPIEFMWLKFKEWADMYGPIYQTSMLGTKFVIVTDEKIAEELLVKRAKIYSDRPAVPSLYDSKSTHGSMEYLPLMGKNRRFYFFLDFEEYQLTNYGRVLGTSTQTHPCLLDSMHQRSILWCHGL
jgi:hypothetical protein